MEAMCTVFEAVGGVWFESLPDTSYLPLLCTFEIDHIYERARPINVEVGLINV
jgi:hypothetical protein